MQTLFHKYKTLVIIFSSLIYALVNLFLIVEYSFYWGLAFPLILIVIYFYVFSYDKILFIILFTTPFAFSLNDFQIGFGISIPTEPLLAGLVLLFILRLFLNYGYDKSILKHPISLIIMASLFWMFITTISSEYPIVSLKYFFSRIWFVIPFYFMLIPLFKDTKNIKAFYWLYAIPLVGVIIYTTYRHSIWGFSEEAAHWVMSPFYNDHTAYGTALALFIPVFAEISFRKIVNFKIRYAALTILAILFLAIVLSFSRAAWLSVCAAFGVFLLVKFKLKFKWVLLMFIVLIGVFISFQNELVFMLERNKQESSENMAEHVKSMSNISSDASNLERINRWQSAIRLFKERPILGWGPGTYQFVYAPYQKAKEKTQISTNAGNMGSVHSEFLGPLTEMGILGLLFVILLLIYVFKIGLDFYKHCQNRELKMLSLVSVLGLVSYFTHGLLNNFLETDKLAIPVFGFIAIIVALDIYHKKNPDSETRI